VKRTRKEREKNIRQNNMDKILVKKGVVTFGCQVLGSFFAYSTILELKMELHGFVIRGMSINTVTKLKHSAVS